MVVVAFSFSEEKGLVEVVVGSMVLKAAFCEGSGALERLEGGGGEGEGE